MIAVGTVHTSVRKLRHRELESLALDRTARNWESQGWNI